MLRPDPPELLENHLAFSAWHRGRVLRAPDAIRIESGLPGFRCLLPLTPAARARLSAYKIARLLPWTRLDDGALAEHGYTRNGGLVYLVLRELRLSASSPGVGTDTVSDRAGMAGPRERGVARALLAAALGQLERGGARIAEAYPVRPRDPRRAIPAAFAWTGTRALFDAAGFRVVDNRGGGRERVRRVLAAPSRARGDSSSPIGVPLDRRTQGGDLYPERP